MIYIPAAVRKQVIERAQNCCEYCLVSQQDRIFSFEVDHIIAEKHGGSSELSNLSWSCYLCNGYKGSDIGSIDWQGSETLTPLFNPRKQKWTDHFQLDTTTGFIKSVTAEGRVTVFLLKLNSEEHLASRQLLMQLGRYPCK